MKLFYIEPTYADIGQALFEDDIVSEVLAVEILWLILQNIINKISRPLNFYNKVDNRVLNQLLGDMKPWVVHVPLPYNQ